MERAAFLERVRASLEGVTAPSLPTSWPPTPASSSTDPAGGPSPAERFGTALAGTNGISRVVDRVDLAEAVADAVRQLPSGRRTVVAADTDPFRDELDEGLALAGADVIRPSAATWLREATQADLGVTSAVLGVAATGSVLLAPGPKAPRVASLLPPAHLVLLPVARLVDSLDDAMPAVASLSSERSSSVLVTGPSRTSDIEMTTVYGVHGPGVVRVLLIA